VQLSGSVVSSTEDDAAIENKDMARDRPAVHDEKETEEAERELWDWASGGSGGEEGMGNNVTDIRMRGSTSSMGVHPYMEASFLPSAAGPHGWERELCRTTIRLCHTRLAEEAAINRLVDTSEVIMPFLQRGRLQVRVWQGAGTVGMVMVKLGTNWANTQLRTHSTIGR
jgi:hypothetical protein